SRPTRYPPRFRAHAVASVALARPRHSSTWAAIKAVAASLAISTETLRTWVRQAESSGGATGPANTCGHQTEIRRLNRENADLRQALDLLRATDGAAPWTASVTITPAGAPTGGAPPEQRTPPDGREAVRSGLVAVGHRDVAGGGRDAQAARRRRALLDVDRAVAGAGRRLGGVTLAVDRQQYPHIPG
ncbi:transposase, partial [Frankia gtarii]